jgi:hypothetical protein
MTARKIFIILTLLACSCSLHPTLSPRLFVPLTALQSASTEFDQYATKLVDLWNVQDKQQANDLFTADAVMTDKSYGDRVVGPQQILGMISSVAAFGKNWQSRQADQYIGLKDGLAIDELWSLKFGNVSYTLEHPLVEVDWLQTTGDKISSWTLFYSLESLEELNIPTTTRLDQANHILTAYPSAWSTGDGQFVSELYTPEAIREDTLFSEQQVGQNAIRDYAESFFAWYPGAQWSLSAGFGEGNGTDQITGGLYTITVIDNNGQSCEVKVAVLFRLTDNLVTHETLFYQPRSIIACGWVN